MKRWIVLGVVVLAAAAGVWWKSRAKGEAPRYRTATVERGSIRSVVSATGTIQPVVQVQVGSQVSGTVSKLFADFNDRVKQGEVLCQLEPAAFRAREAQAEAAVAHAEAALEEAQRQLKRTNELVKGNYVSQADVEAAQVEVDQRAADLKQARAQLQAAAVDLANTTIRAPIDGVVIARTIDIGQTVAASLQAPQLFVIANDLAQMQVETKIDEADIGRIRAGLPVTFTVDAYPDAEFQGSVTQVRLQPIVESGVVTYTTVIRTQNRELKLRPGMTANVSVMVAIKDDVLKVPSAALRFHPPMESAGRRGGQGGGMAMGGAGRPGGAGGAGRGQGELAMRGGDASAATRDAGTGAVAGSGDPGARQHARGDGSWQRGQGEAGGWGGRGAGGRRGMRNGSPDSVAAPAAMAASGTQEVITADPPRLKPGVIYVLRDGKPARIPLMTGIGDGASFEVESDQLNPGDAVIVGLELPIAQNRNLQPPPGMGGPTFRGPGGGRGR